MNGEHPNTKEALTTDPATLIKSLVERLRARADNAYCDMIGVARRDESLGWEIKVERGKFGRPELDAHVKGGELLGRHRALHEAATLVEEELKELLK
jgi:hypothetical protein